MQIVMDCADPARLAAFWAAALPGYALQPAPAGFESWEAFLEAQAVPKELWNSRSAIVGDGPRLFFQQVPEPKTAKNRVHLDLRAAADVAPEGRADALEAECTRLLALGARRLRRL